MKNFKGLTVQPRDGWPNSEDIIKEYFENMLDSSGTEELNYPVWSIPSRLMNYPYLPPSLQPVTSERMIDCNFSKWGWEACTLETFFKIKKARIRNSIVFNSLELYVSDITVVRVIPRQNSNRALYIVGTKSSLRSPFQYRLHQSPSGSAFVQWCCHGT